MDRITSFPWDFVLIGKMLGTLFHWRLLSDWKKPTTTTKQYKSTPSTEFERITSFRSIWKKNLANTICTDGPPFKILNHNCPYNWVNPHHIILLLRRILLIKIESLIIHFQQLFWESDREGICKSIKFCLICIFWFSDDVIHDLKRPWTVIKGGK